MGNCQARPIAKILESLNPTIEVTAIAIVHLLKSEQFSEYQQDLEKADLIVSQLVFDTYPCDFVQTNFLKSTYGSKVVSIVNLYFAGYTPDWFYLRIPERGPLRGPMGDYHNRTVFESWQQGKKAEKASFLLEDCYYNERYLPEVEESLLTLKKREDLVDVAIADFIEKYFRRKRLFFTFNHPTMFLLRQYCKRILKESGIRVQKKWFSFVKDAELLDQFVPLVNPAVALPAGNEVGKHLGVDFKIRPESLVTIGVRKEYTSLEIVKSYYHIYNQLNEQLGLDKIGVEDK